MIEIAAAVIGVLLATYLGYVITNYRSLITYEITRVPQEFAIRDHKLVPAEPGTDIYPITATAYSLEIINRGWKSLKTVKLHIGRDIQPFSVEIRPSSISKQTVSVKTISDGVEIFIDYMPRKEKIVITFTSLNGWWVPDLTGAGESYKVESVNYFIGIQNAVTFLKNLLIVMIIFGALGAFLGNQFFNGVGIGSTALNAPSHTRETQE